MTPQLIAGGFATLVFGFAFVLMLAVLPRRAKLVAVLPGGCAAVTAIWTVFQLVAAHSGGQAARVLAADPASVRSIRLEPAPAPGPPSLVPATVRVADRASIASVVAALHASTPNAPNHPHGVWSVVLGIEDARGFAYAVVEQTERQGVLVDVSSDRTEGWMLAQRRDDALGPLLVRLAGGRAPTTAPSR